MKVIVKIQCCKENKLIKPPKSKPLPYSDVFVDFPGIPRSRNRDLKTTNNAFQGSRKRESRKRTAGEGGATMSCHFLVCLDEDQGYN